MNPLPQILFRAWRLLALAGCLTAAAAGCVDINDAKVQVKPPSEVDPYGRNVLDKCAVHIYPHRLIVGHTGSSTLLAQNGTQMISDQRTFDQYWNNVSVNANDQVSNVPISSQPNVNWDHEVAYFLVVTTGNSCEKAKPMPDGMTTDCYSISIPIYRYQEGNNCQAPSDYSVFIYIFSKINLPFDAVWVYPTPVPTSTPKPPPAPTPRPLSHAEGEDI